jgi:hypothetical protein
MGCVGRRGKQCDVVREVELLGVSTAVAAEAGSTFAALRPSPPPPLSSRYPRRRLTPGGRIRYIGSPTSYNTKWFKEQG